MALDFLVQDMRYVIDVNTGLVQEPRRTMLAKGDKNANRLIVQLVDNGKPVDATGAVASGRFIRPPDGAEVPLEGSVNGSEISVVFNEHCYLTSGRYEADIILTVGEVKRTILTVTGEIHYSGSGAYVDIAGVIPSIDDVVAQLDAMEQATQDTQAATKAANEAAQKIKGLTVSATDGGSAAASVTEKNGVKHIDFTLPQGPTGPVGPKGDGLYAFHVDESGHLICTYDTESPPPLSIDENGHLIYTISDGRTIDFGKVTA